MHQHLSPMAKIIAIDWGKKRTGLAETDDLQIIASPLTTVDTSQIFDFLFNYFSKNRVVKALVGEPKQMDGTISESHALIEGFVKEFKAKFPAIEVVRVDERFTSKLASQSLVASGAKKKSRQNKAHIDQIAATIMLQDSLLKKSC